MKKLILFILALFIAHGCSNQPKQISQLSDSNNTGLYQPLPTLPTDGKTQGINDNPNFGGTSISQPIPSERIIYFYFNQSDIRFNDRLVLEQHAAYLALNPQISVRLEGHADERGSREYNLALGERRALTAKRALNILGVDNYRINTLSYGEEMPLEYGHAETSWQRNRRVEIVYP
ncbi:peptidoglycan-associated lipoprotein Pal [Candidatus Albibeggiatoa sp. nov. BB20]|uniref:peptidoglycan-associated lipoprotein Pal n=1 Tax=Candidatus Albibeggiatoa sp. nov. BB20 TaxID=3162723 RepID=UPI0033654B3A